jgi:hypothetical protein
VTLRIDEVGVGNKGWLASCAPAVARYTVVPASREQPIPEKEPHP